MLTKGKIRELLQRDNLSINKRLGQNFLIDRNVRDKALRLMCLKKDDVILEIGPGLGALTEALAERCRRIYAVEKDKGIYELAKELLAGYKNLRLIPGDFLKFDIETLRPGRIIVAGALPYYITTPIIQQILKFHRLIDTAYIIVQREVAKRLTAKAGEDDYGSLSLFVQFSCDVDILMNINRGSFFPAPEVHSALVRLKLLSRPRVRVKDKEMLFKVIRTAFNQRRKTILSSLSNKRPLGLDKETMRRVLDNIGIDSGIRCELLTLEHFAGLADSIVDNGC